MNIRTAYDIILWYGYKTPLTGFDPNTIEDTEEKKEALKKGLKICEDIAKDGNMWIQEVLAKYFYSAKEYRKALYWANKCAEQGSSEGFEVLCDAHVKGNGVIPDSNEVMKWMFLAAAAGHEGYKNLISEWILEKSTWEPLVEGKTMAKKWMEDHPKAFASPYEN